MKTKIKLLIVIIIPTFLFSCNFSGVVGSKNVITQNRELTETFNSVKVSTGIDLYITQSDITTLKVEVDDNIADLLITEVKDGTLIIYFDKMVGKVKSKKVYLTLPTLNSILASSGAEVKGKDEIKGTDLEVSASSGAEIGLILNYNNVNCSASSGSEVELLGACSDLDLDANSGSEIEAKELKSENAEVSASSGAGISLFVSEKITASASSGGDIDYFGNPKEKDISKSSGGNVNSK